MTLKKRKLFSWGFCVYKKNFSVLSSSVFSDIKTVYWYNHNSVRANQRTQDRYKNLGIWAILELSNPV